VRKFLKTDNPLMRSTAAVLLIAISAANCGGNGITIENCHDQYGRGSTLPNALKVTCVPAGSDLSCQAIADNSASNYVYCPTSENVTTKATWAANDSAIAVADPTRPGFFRTIGDGIAVITAAYQRLPVVVGARPFLVSPGIPAEQMVALALSVLSSDQTRLSGVDIVLEQARGPVQTCVTANGSCSPVRFRVISGSATIRAAKAGFQALTMTLPIDISHGDLSQQITLIPLGQ
jgi:hypothetical protein